MSARTLTPAIDLAKASRFRYPNESDDYRRARDALLAEEIELRRHIERVAEQRRKLPPGGEVAKAYGFVGEQGPVTFADLFRNKDTLVIYSYMFGPERETPCPMCTSLMGAWDHKVPDIEQRVAFACVARAPIERLKAAKQARGWRKLKIYSDTEGDYTRDYVSREDADIPAYNVFTRRQQDGKPVIHHFWSGEMGGAMADPGQDPRGAPDLDPLWLILDTTPEGRGKDWYPKLSYG
jgi:predicted dithiol-disulfide oxidoreductase (DUF899 family)